MKKTNPFSKVLALILAIMVLLSNFSILSVNAADIFEQQSVGKNATIIELGASFDEAPIAASYGLNVSGSSSWGAVWKKTLTYTNVITKGKETFYGNQKLVYHKIDGKIAYCIQPFLCIRNDGNYFSITEEESNKSYWNKLKSNESIRTALAKIMAYSKQKVKGDGAYYHATQLLLWEIIMGIRDTDFNLKNGKKQLYTVVSCSTTAKKTSLKNGYVWILNKLKSLDNIPSGFFTTSTKADKASNDDKMHFVKLKTKTSDGYYRFKSTRTISGLSNYMDDCKLKVVTVNNGNEGIPDDRWNFKIARSGNKIAVTCEDFSNGKIYEKNFFLKITKEIPAGDKNSVYQNKSANSQTLSAGLKYTPESVVGYLGFYYDNVESDIYIQKHIETTNGKDYTGNDYSGWNFLVKENGTSNEYVLTTNKNGITKKLGTVAAKEIPVGTKFTIEELGKDITSEYATNPDAYSDYHTITTHKGKIYAFPSEFKSVTEKQVVTTESEFAEIVEWTNEYDNPFKLTVNKICEDDASVKGYYFYVYDINHTKYNDEEILKPQIIGPTNDNGTISVSFGISHFTAETMEVCIQELGLLNDGANYSRFGDNFNDYTIPEQYDTKLDEEHLPGLNNVSYRLISNEELKEYSAEVEYENTCSGYIAINKTDSVTEKSVAGATYGIYTRAQSNVDTSENEGTADIINDDTLIQEIVTDEKGYAISKSLGCGTYYVKEISAPDGYYLDAEIYEVEVKPDINTEAHPNVITLDLKDIPTQLVFNKIEASTTFSNGEFVEGAVIQILNSINKVITEFTTTDEPTKIIGLLSPGSTYTIHEKSTPNGYVTANDITVTISTDGSVNEVTMYDKTTKIDIFKKNADTNEIVLGAHLKLIDSQNNEIATWISSDKPHTLERMLIVGETYTLTETKAPEGFKTAEPVTFTVLDTENTQVVTMLDEITKIKITKYDITNKEELPGAHLVVKDSEGRVIDSWVSTTEPHYIEGKLIVGEKYTLEETIAPNGYATTSSIEFTVDDKNGVQTVDMYDDITKVAIGKYMKDTDTFLAGAEFELKDKEGNVVETWISTTEAHVIEGKLIVGETYTLIETKSPAGYTTIPNATFTVQDSPLLQVLSIYDDPTVIEVSKTDITGDKEIEGAKLTVIDKDGNVVDEWISKSEPHYIKGKLIVGETYTLHETLAPVGYAYASDVTFTVQNTGEIQKVSMKDDITKVKFIKIDAKTDKPLPEAELELIDSEGNTVKTWTSTKKAYVLEGVLEAGKEYTLREKTAPDGYSLADNIKFIVNKNGKEQTITMEDYPIKKFKLPKTGDNVLLYVLIALSIFSVFVAAFIYTYRRSNTQRR